MVVVFWFSHPLFKNPVFKQLILQGDFKKALHRGQKAPDDAPVLGMPWLRCASKQQQRYPGSPCVSSVDRPVVSMSHTPGEPTPGWLSPSTGTAAAPPYPALHHQEQMSCALKADGVSSIHISEGRDDAGDAGEGKWLQALQPEQQFSSVGLSLFKEWCNQATDYLWLSMVKSPSAYLCLWKSSQNLLTCDYSSGTPFSQLKWITCFFLILTFTAITFSTFLFLILQRERWNGVQTRKVKIHHLPALKYKKSPADVIHCLMTWILLKKSLWLKKVRIKINWQTVCFFPWLNRRW